MLQRFGTEAFKIPNEVKQKVAKLFITRSKIRHTLAFCEWRRNFSQSLSEESRDQIDEMIESHKQYFTRTNKAAAMAVEQYQKKCSFVKEQSKFKLDVNHLKEVLGVSEI